MAEILCYGCGIIIDSHANACPRCGCCPNCGVKRPAESERCPTCGYPSNESDVTYLETRHDPKLAANQKAAKWLERDWLNQQLMSRLHYWKVFGAILLTLPIVMYALFGLLNLLGINDSWLAGLGFASYFYAYYFILPNLLRRGWFPWLLKE